MKVPLFVLAMALPVLAAAGGSHSVRGYVKADGTSVAPSRATNPNGSKRDNYSTKGNVNPYTGKAGTVDPDAAPPPLKTPPLPAGKK